MRRAPLHLRARVYVIRGALDHRLASGESPLSKPTLRLRAAQLRRPRTRHALARSLRRIVDIADNGPRGLSAAVPLNRAEVLASREELLELALELEAPGTVRARGVALVRCMVCEGDSTLYAGGRTGTLSNDAATARAALRPLSSLRVGRRCCEHPARETAARGLRRVSPVATGARPRGRPRSARRRGDGRQRHD